MLELIQQPWFSDVLSFVGAFATCIAIECYRHHRYLRKLKELHNELDSEIYSAR